MKTKDIVKEINSNGGLDFSFITSMARKEGISISKYIYEYIKASYECSPYIAKKVTEILY